MWTLPWRFVRTLGQFSAHSMRAAHFYDRAMQEVRTSAPRSFLLTVNWGFFHQPWRHQPEMILAGYEVPIDGGDQDWLQENDINDLRKKNNKNNAETTDFWTDLAHWWMAVPKRKVSRSRKRMKTTLRKRIELRQNIITDPRTGETTLRHRLPFNWKDYLPQIGTVTTKTPES